MGERNRHNLSRGRSTSHAFTVPPVHSYMHMWVGAQLRGTSHHGTREQEPDTEGLCTVMDQCARLELTVGRPKIG